MLDFRASLREDRVLVYCRVGVVPWPRFRDHGSRLHWMRGFYAATLIEMSHVGKTRTDGSSGFDAVGAVVDAAAGFAMGADPNVIELPDG